MYSLPHAYEARQCRHEEDRHELDCVYYPCVRDLTSHLSELGVRVLEGVALDSKRTRGDHISGEPGAQLLSFHLSCRNELKRKHSPSVVNQGLLAR